MKTEAFFIVLVFTCSSSFAQLDINRLLAAGVEDTQLYAEDYFSPGLDAVAFSLTNGWFNSAESKKLGQFEISFIGNLSEVTENQQSFQLNTADYQILQFQNGPSIQNVANVLGENDPDIQALAVFEDENGNQQNIPFELPQGISSSGLNYVPTLLPQLSLGFIAGVEFKFRYLPKIERDEGNLEFYGVGLQHEISRWIPGLKSLPIHLGLAVNYTKFMGDFTLSETPIVDSNNGVLYSEFTAWSYSALVSTKLRVINFYAGISYIHATSDFGLRGDFNVNQGVLAGESINDPFSTTSSISGFRGTLGARLSLAFFSIHADYSIQEFNTLSAGISFGI